MSDTKTLVLKNYMIQKLVTGWLDIELERVQGRPRNRFIKLLAPFTDEMEKARVDELQKLARKDDTGALAMSIIDGKQSYELAPENATEFQKFYGELMWEDCVIDILPSNEADLRQVKVLIENLDRKMNTQDTAIHEEILNAFNAAFPVETPVATA